LIKKRDLLNKKVHKKWNTSELVPKGIKEIRKQLETGSGDHKAEAGYIKDIKFLTDSIPFITEKEAIDAQLDKQFKKKKEASKDLPAII